MENKTRQENKTAKYVFLIYQYETLTCPSEKVSLGHLNHPLLTNPCQSHCFFATFTFIALNLYL